MQIRLACPDDVEDILRWRNDPRARAMSRNSDLIDEGSHRAWFDKALVDPDKILLIGVFAERKIGMVRFDRMEAMTWEISIILAPVERAKKQGRPLLSSTLEFFRATNPGSIVVAEIKQQNLASLQLFKSIGFVQKCRDGQMLRFFLKDVSLQLEMHES